jgi:transposase
MTVQRECQRLRALVLYQPSESPTLRLFPNHPSVDSVSGMVRMGDDSMGRAIEITRTEHSASDLRAIAARVRDGGQVRRLLALALVKEGSSRTEAALRCGMDRQTLRDWVHRYNAEGVDGLKSGHGPGQPSSLSADQMSELHEVVLKGPDPEKDRVVRWRCADLREEVARRFGVEVTERTIGKWLRKLRLTRLQPRPFHPKKDEAAQETFKKTSRAW